MNAPSTIGMSSYNLLALRDPEHVDSLLDLLRLEGIEVHKITYQEAIAGLLERKLVTQSDDGVLAAKGPRGWIVVTREREPSDGWDGWVAKQVSTGARRSLRALLEAT